MKEYRENLYQKALSESFSNPVTLQKLIESCMSLLDEESCIILKDLSSILFHNRQFQACIDFLNIIYNIQSSRHFCVRPILTESEFHWYLKQISACLPLPSIDRKNFIFKENNINLAHITNVISEGHGPTNVLTYLIKYLDKNIFNLSVYVTDYCSDSNQRGNNIIHTLEEYGARVILLPPPFSSDMWKSKNLIEKILSDNIDIAIFYAQCCPLSSITAMKRVAPLMIQISVSSIFYHSQIDHFITASKHDYNLHPYIHNKSTIIPLGSDFHNKLNDVEKMHFDPIFDHMVKIGSIGHLHKMANKDFVEIAIQILKENPTSCFLFAGNGTKDEIEFIVRAFRKEDLDNRVKYMGLLTENLPSFIKSLDLCLNTYPFAGGSVSLEVMSAGIPIMSVRKEGTYHWNVSYDNIGLEELIIPFEEKEKFYQLAKRLIHDINYRREIGKKLRMRYLQEFRFDIVVKKYENLFLDLYRDKLAHTKETI